MTNRFLKKELPDNSFGKKRPERPDTAQKKNLEAILGIKRIIDKKLDAGKKLDKIIEILGRPADSLIVKNWPEIQAIKGEVVAEVKNWPKGPQNVKISDWERPKWWQDVDLSKIEAYLGVLSEIKRLIANLRLETDISQHQDNNKALAVKLFEEQFKKIISKLDSLGGVSAFEASMNEYLKLISQGVTLNDSDNTIGKVKINSVEFGTPISTSVDNSAVQIFDSSANQTAVGLIITNAGDDDIYIYPTNSVTSTLFIKKLGAGESWEIALGGENSTTNDLYAIRATAQTNDDVIVMPLTEM